jgi:cystathionine beta-synthase
MKNKKAYNSILDTIGNIPLVRLNKITEELEINPDIEIFAKIEFLNPMGSIKDRIAKYMIEKAEKQGKIKKGQTIVENSSGNTALGLALIAIQKGYKLKVVVRDSMSKDKINKLESLGVDIIFADTSLPPESPNSYNNITSKIVKETKNVYFPDQHNNKDNNEAHYNTTGPEIWEQMEGKIDYFIAGMGTGGTIGGTAKFLKEKDPNIKVIAVDPVGSIFYDYFYSKKIIKPEPYLIEGLGDEFLIKTADFSNIDEIIRVKDKDAFLMARRLVKKEGLLGGGSSGAAIWAVSEFVKNLSKPARIVTILPDSSSRYLSTIFNDSWMKEKGFI